MTRASVSARDVTRPSVLLIADDLTGAADAAVTFAKQGGSATVYWANAHRSTLVDAQDVDVVAITTESRYCAGAEARQRTASALSRPTPLADWVYKKVDSTLRGHPGGELAALMTATAAWGPPFQRALVAPALPSQGRTTRSGIHYVDGVPLAESVFGSEVTSSSVLGLFRGKAGGPVAHLPLSTLRAGEAAASAVFGEDTRVVVADAETDADLVALVGVARKTGIRLLCGSAGLAEALARCLAARWPDDRADGPTRPMGGQGVLVVAGSRNPRTLQQIRSVNAAGVQLLRPDADFLMGKETELSGLVPRLAAALEAGAAVLTTAGLPSLSVPGQVLASRLAAIAAEAVARHRPTGIVVTGGEVAIAVCRALGTGGFRLYGEVRPGVPWGTLIDGLWEGLPLVTKAGGFGDEDTLMAAIEFLGGSQCAEVQDG